VERIAPLIKKARDLLWELDIKSVGFLHEDGGYGWQAHAPYNGILAAAAAEEIPPALLDQLAVGGVMLIPIGREDKQALFRVIRKADSFEYEMIEAVTFVPFLSGVSR
jgi:protein-L-isoaspartate(D-aspartate) O-methyltransferase